MKRQWKATLAIICCLVLVVSLLTACNITVQVVFDPNYEGAKVQTRTVLSGVKVTPPTLTRDGYEFAGWYKDKDCSQPVSDSDFVIFSNVTFYADWTSTEVTLVRITATYVGSDLEIGWALNPNDVKVTAFYSDGTSKTVTDFTLSTLDTSTVGPKTVTVTYLTQEAEITVTVIEPVPKNLVDITAEYTGGSVKLGEQPNKSLLKVIAYYSNDSHRAVTNFETDEIDSETEGVKDWTVSYTENDITKSAVVKINVVEVKEPQEKEYNVNVIKNEQLSIHFLELGNQYIGDSVYIKAGDTDILIDAGSREDSSLAIANYVNKYCTDGILEYVIVTHAHQDHIAGFVGNNNQGIFDLYECKNIIEFSKYNTTSKISQNYFAKRNVEVQNGANCYTAEECVNNANGAKKVYDLTGDGSITMKILDQKYYHQKASGENNHSVCVLISQGDNHYLFTGDLEKEGEESLVAYNPDLPEVQLYKGGHHGSSTSSNEVLMAKVKPQTVCVCSCAGSVEYSQNIMSGTFPTQDFINRVAPYTDRVYITTLMHTTLGVNSKGESAYVNTTYESMNGDIVFACTNNQITMYFTNNNIKLKDTDWFKEYRKCPTAWI